MSDAIRPRTGSPHGRPGVLAAVLLAAVGGCASIRPVDPVRDDGSAAFAAACVGVLAAEQAAADRAEVVFAIEGRRALSEWVFQASRRSNLFEDEIGRARKRRRWAEALPAAGRSDRVATCVGEIPT